MTAPIGAGDVVEALVDACDSLGNCIARGERYVCDRVMAMGSACTACGVAGPGVWLVGHSHLSCRPEIAIGMTAWCDRCELRPVHRRDPSLIERLRRPVTELEPA